jgi:hypothetical protein
LLLTDIVIALLLTLRLTLPLLLPLLLLAIKPRTLRPPGPATVSYGSFQRKSRRKSRERVSAGGDASALRSSCMIG